MVRITKAEVSRILRVERRKRIIKMRGFKFSDIGHKGDVSRVIAEKLHYPKLQRKIAKAAGVPYKQFWAGSR